MGNDLDSSHLEWLHHTVKKSRNTYELVSHLRNGGDLSPALKLLIADILEGVFKARFKTKTMRDVLTITNKAGKRVPSVILVSQLEHLTWSMNTESEWFKMKEWLRLVGYRGKIETKGQRTKAAKFLICHQYGLTVSQLDEILHPRAVRTKNA